MQGSIPSSKGTLCAAQAAETGREMRVRCQALHQVTGSSLDVEVPQKLVTGLLHDLCTGVKGLVDSVPKAHQPIQQGNL